MITSIDIKAEVQAPELIAVQQVCFAIQSLSDEPVQLGVDISLVREVLTLRHITPVSLSHEAVLGIFDWRGQIIPVVDLSEVLGRGRVVQSSRNRLLVIEKQDSVIAFVVSNIIGIVRTIGTLEPIPPEIDLDPTVVRGSVRTTLGRVILLDLDAI